MNPQFFNALFKNIDPIKRDSISQPYICLHSHDNSGLPYFEYLVVDPGKSEENQFIARFNDLSLAMQYVNFILDDDLKK